MERSDFFPLWSDRLLSILRIVVAGLFIQHGAAKLFGIPYIAQMANTPLMSLGGAAGVIELAFGLLLLIGLYTRFAAFILSGEMAVGYFIAHAPHGTLPILNGGELAAVYCWVFLYFAVAGGGVWSLDAMRARGSSYGRPVHREFGHESRELGHESH